MKTVEEKIKAKVHKIREIVLIYKISEINNKTRKGTRKKMKKYSLAKTKSNS